MTGRRSPAEAGLMAADFSPDVAAFFANLPNDVEVTA